MKRISLAILLFVVAATCGMAEETLHVSGLQAVPGDPAAVNSSVKDNNGDPCALLRVYIDDPTARFNGEIVGEPARKDNYFELWLLDATQRIEVISQKAVPVWVEFGDYGIDEVQSGHVYSLTLKAPPVNYKAIKNPGTINLDFFPYGAVVFVDEKKVGVSPCTISGLKKGKHKVTVWANGFNMFEEDVKIKDWKPVDLKGSLLKKYTASGIFTHIGNTYKKEKKSETKDGKTVTKNVTTVSGHDTTQTREEIVLQFAFVDPAIYGKDDALFGIMEAQVTNRLWRIIMGADNEHASNSESEIVDAFYYNNKVEAPAMEVVEFCKKLGKLYGRNFRIPTYNELRWARQLENVKDLDKLDKKVTEWSMEQSILGDEKQKFRIVLADVTEADLDLGDSAVADNLTYKSVKNASKEGKGTGWVGRALMGVARDMAKRTFATEAEK